MSIPEHPTTEELLAKVVAGDRLAADALFARHRQRLAQMIAVRIDPQHTGRADQGDVLRETLAKASRLLPDYLRERPIPFYPWLRQIARDQLAELHSRHTHTRSDGEPAAQPRRMSDASVMQLADRLLDESNGLLKGLLHKTVLVRVESALAKLDPDDREILVLRNLEQVTTAQTAAILQLTEREVKQRHLRAVQRLRRLIERQQ